MGRAILVGTLIFALGAMMMFSVLPAMAQPEITPDTDIQTDGHAITACTALGEANTKGASVPIAVIILVCG